MVPSGNIYERCFKLSYIRTAYRQCGRTNQILSHCVMIHSYVVSIAWPISCFDDSFQPCGWMMRPVSSRHPDCGWLFGEWYRTERCSLLTLWYLICVRLAPRQGSLIMRKLTIYSTAHLCVIHGSRLTNVETWIVGECVSREGGSTSMAAGERTSRKPLW